MLVCYHRAAQSAISVGGGCVVTKQVALLINVLMWHYSGLYPPPFRLGFHTGRGCAVGITLNKHSNTILLAVSQSLVLVLQRESILFSCSDLELILINNFYVEPNLFLFVDNTIIQISIYWPTTLFFN